MSPVIDVYGAVLPPFQTSFKGLHIYTHLSLLMETADLESKPPEFHPNPSDA
jgi:hypothetical protein